MPISNKEGVFDKYLTHKEEKQLLSYVDKQKCVLARRDHAWMVFMRLTGVRVGTMAKFTVDDAFKMIGQSKLFVRDEAAKGGNGYSSYLQIKAVACLKKLLAIHKEMGGKQVFDDPLVLTRRLDALSVRSYQDRMVKWRKESGLQVQVTPHYMRHTLGKRIVENSTSDQPLQIAQAALGHKNLNTTSIYTMPDREQVEATMEAASR